MRRWINGGCIVTDPDAPVPTKYAALQLQEYVRRMTGTTVPIEESPDGRDSHFLRPLPCRCVFAGPSSVLRKRHPDVAARKLKDEEVLILREGDSLVLTGGGKRGVLYAVYIFLEKFCGCRFFTADCEFVPGKLADLPDKLCFRSAPAFESRDIFSLWTTSGDWAARNRLNGHFAKVSSLQGGKRDILPFVHTAALLVPPDEYFASHPEYFSLIKGERNPRQLCLSNPKVQEIAVRRVFEWIEDRPECDIFDVSENDGGGECLCPECRKMNGDEPGSSGTLFRFVNLVADAVAARYPGKCIETISYGHSNLYAPKGFRLSPNVIVRVCANTDMRRRLPEWLSAADKVYVWHYLIYKDYMVPFPMMDAISKVTRGYLRQGVKGLYLQTPECEHGGVETMKLQAYVASKLLWNPEEDPRTHKDEFIRHYYGPAASEMHDLFEMTCDMFRRKNVRFSPWNWTWDTSAVLSTVLPELEEKSRPLFQVARRKCRDSEYRDRLDEAEVPFLYFRLFGKDASARFTRDRAYPRYLPGKQGHIHRFFGILEKSGIVNVAEAVPYSRLRDALCPLGLKRLKNRRLEVLVVPGCGGRIVQVVFRATNTGMIPVPPNLLNFEDVGYEEYAGRWYHSPGYREPFRVEEEDGKRSSIRLAADLSNGFRMTRTIRLEGNCLHVETGLTNTGRETRAGEIRIHPVWKGNPETDEVLFATASGKEVRVPIARFHNQYLEEKPDGAWTFLLTSRGIRMENRFPADRTRKVFVFASGERFTCELFTESVELAPGEGFVYRNAYTFEQA